MASIKDEEKCKYNFLGKSGLKVSNMCLGAMNFGESKEGFSPPGTRSEEASHEMMDRYVAWGGNFIDTADIYGRGKSEEVVGTWLNKQARDNFVIATKARSVMGKSENSGGLSRRHLTEAVEKSLQRLKTDYIDLYQPHGWDDATPIEETLRTLDDLVRCGKIRYIGYCNVIGWHMQQIQETAEKLGLNPCISLQQQYNLVCRESEWEPFQVCKANGIGVLPWSPLKGGLLTGKVKRGKKPEEGRLAWVAEDDSRKSQAGPSWKSFDDKIFDIVEAAEAIGKAKGRTTAQVSIRWLLQKDVVSSVIIGPRTLEQLDDNMRAANGWGLTKEEMEKLDELSTPELPYPYEMVFRMNKTRVNAQGKDAYVRSVYS